MGGAVVNWFGEATPFYSTRLIGSSSESSFATSKLPSETTSSLSMSLKRFTLELRAKEIGLVAKLLLVT